MSVLVNVIKYIITNYIIYIESLDEDKVSEEELRIYTQMQKVLKKHKHEYSQAINSVL